MYCIETLDCVLGTKDDFTLDNTTLRQVKKIFNQPNRLVTIPLCYDETTDLRQENLLPAPIFEKISDYIQIDHNYLALATTIASRDDTQYDYQEGLTEQSLANIKQYLDSLNIVTIKNQYLKAVPQSIKALITLYRKLKTSLRTQQQVSHIDLHILTKDSNTFIYSIIGNKAVVYFTNTKDAYQYIANKHAITYIFCGTINKDTEKLNLTATIKPNNYNTVAIGIFKPKPKSLLLGSPYKFISSYTSDEYMLLGLSTNHKYAKCSLSFQKAVDVITYYGWDITKLLVQIKTKSEIIITELMSNSLINYFYLTQPNQSTISKYKHYTFTETSIQNLEYSKHTYYMIYFSKDYIVSFDGKEGKSNRRIKNRFDKLIEQNDLQVVITRDIDTIISKLPEINLLTTKWAKNSALRHEKNHDAFILDANLSTFIPYLQKETLEQLNILGIFLYDKSNDIIGITLSYKPYPDMVEFNQSVTSNSKDDYAGLQTYLNFVKIAEWRKTHSGIITKGITNIERIIHYNLVSLKADKAYKIKYTRSV